jgi:hypothetical protein
MGEVDPLTEFIKKHDKELRQEAKQLLREEVRERKAERRERKAARREEIREEKRTIREGKAARKEEIRERIREENIYIRTKNLPPPYIGEIRYGYDIPHKRKNNFNKYVYKHCSQTSRYEWIKIDEVT